ncbi:Cytochrome P [Parasponia andersonii]|uniref:Cytochrome P n=1 Tax=Parasponia andersonii TaxID=3476 RepID=A0A2P5E2J5_PARAD|nr:Cytochrome P [Parasponia andersonii]
MPAQGIKGPSYRFIHGSTEEITTLKREAMRRPMGLSHAIFPRVQPHIHSWVNAYGKNYLQWHGLEVEFVITEPELIKEVLVKTQIQG